jgi:hypothetical protein
MLRSTPTAQVAKKATKKRKKTPKKRKKTKTQSAEEVSYVHVPDEYELQAMERTRKVQEYIDLNLPKPAHKEKQKRTRLPKQIVVVARTMNTRRTGSVDEGNSADEQPVRLSYIFVYPISSNTNHFFHFFFLFFIPHSPGRICFYLIGKTNRIGCHIDKSGVIQQTNSIRCHIGKSGVNRQTKSIGYRSDVIC